MIFAKRFVDKECLIKLTLLTDIFDSQNIHNMSLQFNNINIVQLPQKFKGL